MASLNAYIIPKAALMCHSNESWVDALPLVVLGLKTAQKEDLKSSSAELLYGKPEDSWSLPPMAWSLRKSLVIYAISWRTCGLDIPL